jgi:hypothetical protein
VIIAALAMELELAGSLGVIAGAASEGQHFGRLSSQPIIGAARYEPSESSIAVYIGTVHVPTSNACPVYVCVGSDTVGFGLGTFVDAYCDAYDVCVIVRVTPGRAVDGSTEMLVAMAMVDGWVVWLLVVLDAEVWVSETGMLEFSGSDDVFEGSELTLLVWRLCPLVVGDVVEV